ncbi:ubiquitin carboxyl-terminal hydrolase MINDY-1 isoform X1 [Ornithorhynchus anatinus]|nr:ubiquitin carboxyl-terminal hydrolase MINDY-1 isoform X1 [Ornithorhynchus anatinus]XP_028911607.1 ubiquitin carboxyl-terminal hydrolase MINDY-1 isoform X1 [Ornithorhynchus anatinus]XP_028911608.1 ubiquitin carboxyl-terminal hydrolase MINDY-1 isoform X1 [Ornithorhynchus anatinus]
MESPGQPSAGTLERDPPENHQVPTVSDAGDRTPEGPSPATTPPPTQDQENRESPPPEASPGRSTPPAARALASPAPRPEADFYCVKWISWKGEQTPIITQNANGPCPLLAIMNVLFLQWKVKLTPQKEVVTSDELMAHLGDCLLSIKPQEKAEALQLNFQQNVADAVTVLPKLSTGLDVNVRFTGVTDFEYTPECSVFDLLGIPLYHGWLVDPQSPEVASAVGKLSYNQLVEKIIACKHSSDSALVTEGLVAEQFLEGAATQLTYHGLCELNAVVREGELSVFFRNNHFSTMVKDKGHLYLLVTDPGFPAGGAGGVESLHSVDGDGCFCDAHFHLSPAPGAAGPLPTQDQQRQVDQDYMIALSLQQQQQPAMAGGTSALSDLELARQLQQEEYQQQPPAGPPSPRAPPPQARGAAPRRQERQERRQRPKQESDCTLL